MVRRHELTDEEWALLAPLLPPQRMGRPRQDDRRILNAMVFKSRTGIAWRDLPSRYGSWKTVYTRFRRWALDGTFDRLLTSLQARADANGAINWLVALDSTIVRAHQHAAGAKGAAAVPRRSPRSEPRRTNDQAASGL